MEEQSELKVATEVAEAEFARWLSRMGLGHKADEQAGRMTEEDLSSFRKAEGIIVRAMESAAIVVTDRGLEFTPMYSDDQKTIVFPRPRGAILLSGDRYKQNESGAKTFAMLGEWTGSPPSRFGKM